MGGSKFRTFRVCILTIWLFKICWCKSYQKPLIHTWYLEIPWIDIETNIGSTFTIRPEHRPITLWIKWIWQPLKNPCIKKFKIPNKKNVCRKRTSDFLEGKVGVALTKLATPISLKKKSIIWFQTTSCCVFFEINVK